MKIIAAVAREHSAPLSIEELEIDSPRDNEVLVELVATGICHTDLVVRDGMLPTPLPVVLGHEGAGIVRAVGSAVKKVVPGDHIVITFDSCGHCESCKDEARSYCFEFFPKNFFATRDDGSVALSDGKNPVHSHFFGQSSFASHAICHEANAVKVPKTLPLKLLGPLACGVQTGAGAIVNSLDVQAGKSIVIFGAGSVGLSAIMAAKIRGAKTIIALDMHVSRLEKAEELGATHVLNANNANVVSNIMNITTTGVNYALDTTGIPAVIRQAIETLAPRGVCGILGASGPDAEITLNETHFMSGGRKLFGIVEGEAKSDAFIPEMIQWFQNGKFPFDKLIRFYPYTEINQAIEDTKSGAAIKPVVEWLV